MAKESKGYNGNLSLKRTRTSINWTKELTDEFKRCADDPIYFSQKYVKIVTLDDGLIPISLYDYQLEIIDKFNKNRNTIVLTGRQQGKALSVDTPIITPSGFRKLDDLVVGDYIYGRDGTPTKISFITETMNERPCYEIEFAHGETITADAEHLWNIVKTGRSDRKSGTEEITVTTTEMIELFESQNKNKQSLHIRMHDALMFDKVDVEIDPYLMGLWLGDGHSSAGRVTCIDEDYKHYKTRLSSRGITIGDWKVDSRTTHTGYFGIDKLQTKLKLDNVYGNKHIPHNYLFNDVETRIELLRGLMDSDGFVNENGWCNFYQSDESFIDSVRFLLSSLGIKSTKRMKKTTHKDSFILAFSTKKFDVVSLPRKLERQHTLKDHPKNSRIYIKSIKKIDSVPVKCLQVDNDDHMFLCGNTLIPTHNTTTAVCLILHFVLFNEHKLCALLSNKLDSSREILSRIQLAYENLPNWLQQGVVEWNKSSVELENGCKIIASATTGSAIRGKSCVGGNTQIKVRNKETGIVSTINMDELASLLNE